MLLAGGAEMFGNEMGGGRGLRAAVKTIQRNCNFGVLFSLC